MDAMHTLQLNRDLAGAFVEMVYRTSYGIAECKGVVGLDLEIYCTPFSIDVTMLNTPEYGDATVLDISRYSSVEMIRIFESENALFPKACWVLGKQRLVRMS